jgi:myo-inositol 2-dehydrogenase / D-chiro-inositol 1-dehydrogenase
MISFALFGAGRIGKVHAHNLVRDRDASLRYVVDVNASAATELAESVGARTNSLEGALSDREVDAVIIASATNTHAELIERSAAAGKAIFCEKPLDIDAARAQMALDAVERNKVPFFLAFNRRFDPDYSALHESLSSGVVGKPELILITSRDHEPPPRDYLLQSGSIFRHMTIHEIDLFRWLTKEEPIEVCAIGSSFVYPELNSGPDTAVVTLRSQSGVIGVINNTIRSSFGYDQRLEVQGERGILAVDNHRRSELVVADSLGQRSAGPQRSFIERFAEAYQIELSFFITSLRAGKTMEPAGKDALRATLIAECAERAYQTKQSVSVPS